jgi:hypothetical protein
VNKLTAFIATTGTNPEFVAFMAHMWFAYAVVKTSGHYLVALPVLALAAFKEFYFDARYESPKQTFRDNLTDWLGYTTGALLACGALALKV